jgi:hypothetical protein
VSGGLSPRVAFACVQEEFTKGACNDAQVGSRCTPSLAREMANPNFPVGATSTFQLIEQLGIDHRSPRFEWVLVEEVSA